MADFKRADECEKQRLIEDDSVPQLPMLQPPSFRERLFRHILPCFLLLLSVSILFRKVFVCHHQYTPEKYLQSAEDEEYVLVDGNTTKVALEAHIMSKCPDAAYCLQHLVVPAMARVGDLVDFKLSYIGSIDPDSDEVRCLHGPSECLGNILQLCAAQIYPEPIMSLGFANCMTSQYKRVPERELVEGCALEHGIDPYSLNSCVASDGEGIDLLRDSFERSRKAGVTKSCTVRLEGQVRCIRDGGKWYDCPGGSEVSDLVSEIAALYGQKN